MLDIEELVVKKKSHSSGIDPTKIRHATKDLLVFLERHRNDQELKKMFLKEFKKVGKKHKIQLRKSDLVTDYRGLLKDENIDEDPLFLN